MGIRGDIFAAVLWMDVRRNTRGRRRTIEVISGKRRIFKELVASVLFERSCNYLCQGCQIPRSTYSRVFGG